MFEPRGHDMMSGSILYPPTREDCDVAILFIETSGCLPMCGHGTIGTVTMAIENGLVKPKTPGVLRLDTPAGLVVAEYRQDGEYVEEVRITNVPSFLHAEGPRVECPGSARSRSTSPMAAISTASSSRRRTSATWPIISRRRPHRWSPVLRQRLNENTPSCIRKTPASTGSAHAVDRQADGTPGRCPQRRVLWRQGDRPLALRHRHLGAHGAAYAKGKLKAGDDFVHESIIGSLFKGRVERAVAWPASAASFPRSAAGRG